MSGSETHLTWTTNQKAYEINDLYLRRVDLTDLAATVDARNQYNLENLKIGKDEISGTVNNLEPGIMVFNIPYNKGWTVTDNGNKIELQRMNGFLSGVKLEPGEHNLQFKFRSQGFYIGYYFPPALRPDQLHPVAENIPQAAHRRPKGIEPIYRTNLSPICILRTTPQFGRFGSGVPETVKTTFRRQSGECFTGDLKDVPDDPYLSDEDDIQSYDLADIQLIESEDAEMDELEIIHPGLERSKWMIGYHSSCTRKTIWRLL